MSAVRRSAAVMPNCFISASMFSGLRVRGRTRLSATRRLSLSALPRPRRITARGGHLLLECRNFRLDDLPQPHQPEFRHKRPRHVTAPGPFLKRYHDPNDHLLRKAIFGSRKEIENALHNNPTDDLAIADVKHRKLVVAERRAFVVDERMPEMGGSFEIAAQPQMDILAWAVVHEKAQDLFK